MDSTGRGEWGHCPLEDPHIAARTPVCRRSHVGNRLPAYIANIARRHAGRELLGQKRGHSALSGSLHRARQRGNLIFDNNAQRRTAIVLARRFFEAPRARAVCAPLVP